MEIKIGQRWRRVNFYSPHIVEILQVRSAGDCKIRIVTSPHNGGYAMGREEIYGCFPTNGSKGNQYWEYLEGQDKPIS